MSIWLWILVVYFGVMFLAGLVLSINWWIREKHWFRMCTVLPIVMPFAPIVLFLVHFRPKLKIRTQEAIEEEKRWHREFMQRETRRRCGFHLRGFDRLRVNSDGPGICTLVILDECPLDCKYCLNPHAKKRSERFVMPGELFNIVKVDNLYFRETGGGITFGGGEPLLQSDKIFEFKKLCPEDWTLNVETSLYVEWAQIQNVIDVVDRWYIDIKDMDYDVFHKYTGKFNACVIENLKFMVEWGLADKMYIRVPRIPGYNTEENIDDSVRFLRKLGLNNIEVFDYVTDRKQYQNPSLPRGKVVVDKSHHENSGVDLTYNARPSAEGKEKCEYLKAVRRAIAKKYSIDYEASPCHHEGCCIGTCPACDAEIRALDNLAGRVVDAPTLPDYDDYHVSRLEWQIWKQSHTMGIEEK